MQTLDDKIKNLLSDFENCWSRAKPTDLISLWDTSEREPYYIAEEVFDPMYSWPELKMYWSTAESLLSKFMIETSRPMYKNVSEHLTVLNFYMHWDALLKEKGSLPIGLDVRVSCILKHIEHKLFFIHYVESPLGALPYLKSTYQNNVRSQF